MNSTTLSMIMWIFAALVLIGLITRRRRRKMRGTSERANAARGPSPHVRPVNGSGGFPRSWYCLVFGSPGFKPAIWAAMRITRGWRI